MIRDLPQFGVGTTLPVYSADISTDRGRVIQPGGAINSPASSTGYFVDWRADTRGNRYGGTAVLTIWVAPATGSSSPAYSLSAQLYRSTATDTTMDNANLQGLTSAGNSPSSPVTITSAWCGGASWQQVGIALPIDTKRALATDESLGIRLWNTGAGSVRIGYDVAGDFPAYLTLPEK